MKKRNNCNDLMFSLNLSKKGSSHLEMVTAFTIFIVFTIFLLYFLKAPGENSLSDTILRGLENSFIEMTSTELISFLIKPNESDCLSLDLSNFALSGNSAVFTLKGEIIENQAGGQVIVDDSTRESKFESNTLTVNANDINISQNESLKVYISEGISNTGVSCTTNGTFSLGTIQREKVLAEVKLSEFEINYTNNYGALKTELKIPENVDFSVTSVDLLNAEKDLPTTTDIISKTIFLDIVLESGEVIKKGVVFKIW